MALITVDIWPHPLTAEGRATRRITCADGASVAQVIDSIIPGSAAARHVAVAIDGTPAPAPAWAGIALRDGEIVTLRRALAGGGGGDNKTLNTVLTIGVIVASFYAAPGVATAFGISAAAAQAGILVAGSLVVNALVPIGPADLPGLALRSRDIADGRGFGRLSLGNRARPHQPMTLVLGQHRVYPDLVSDPRYYQGNDGDLYLELYLSWGIGDLALGTVRIGSADLTTYDAVLTTSSPGADVYASDDWIWQTQRVDLDLETTEAVSRSTDPRAVGGAVLLQTRLGYTNDSGTAQSRSVTAKVTHSGNELISNTYTGDDYSVELDEVAFTLLTPGSSEVEVERTAAASTDARTADQLRYVHLATRRPVPSDHDRSADTVSRLRVRITDQVGGRLDPVHAIVEQQVPVWEDGAWTTDRSPSSNPAALFRAVARGWWSDGGELLAGAGLDATEVDDSLLGAWYDWCEDHIPPLTCNLVVTSEMDCQRLLELVARCGRASPTWQTGALGVVYERDRTPSAVITPSRILAGSMQVSWAAGPLADEVVLRYVDPGKDWGVHATRALAPGVTAPKRSVIVDGTGITDPVLASYLAGLQAAHQSVHRRRMS